MLLVNEKILLTQSNTVMLFLNDSVKYSLLQDSGGRLSEFKVSGKLPDKLRMKSKRSQMRKCFYISLSKTKLVLTRRDREC